MRQLETEAVESFEPTGERDVSGCPFHRARPLLAPDDELVLPRHKRIVAGYSTNELGATEFRVDSGDKEIVFDEPELFAFGEGLVKQSRFVAQSATTWGTGYAWPRVRELL